MLKLKPNQTKLLTRSLLKSRTPFRNVARNLTTATACVSLQQPKTRYFSTFWKTTTFLTAAALTYSFAAPNVLALETDNSNQL